MKGWVYVMSNPAIPNVIKIGFTTKDPNERAKELGTGAPQAYEVEYEVLVRDPKKIEKSAHKKLASKNAGKEWFSCDVDTALSTIKDACKLEDIYLEIHSNSKQPHNRKSRLKDHLTDKTKEEEIGQCADYLEAVKYDSGSGVRKNLKKAYELFSQSAEKGNIKALAALGKAHITGRGAEKDPSQAAPFLKEAAKLGNAEAQYLLANIVHYEEVDISDYKGLSEDELYFELLMLSARQDFPPAQCDLGSFYQLKNNNALALEFYLKSAKQDFALAQRHIGDCYLEGIGVKRDLVTAKNFFVKAAEGKDKIAKKRLKNWEKHESEFYPD